MARQGERIVAFESVGKRSNNNNLKRNNYYGVEILITCKWEYDCKTELVMHTPGDITGKV